MKRERIMGDVVFDEMLWTLVCDERPLVVLKGIPAGNCDSVANDQNINNNWRNFHASKG